MHKAYPTDWDYAWLATDGNGHVAVFTTAGVGPTPKPVLDSRSIVDPIEDLIVQLPIIGGAELLVQVPRPDDFIDFAERGLFSFDWSDVHRPSANRKGAYERQARPGRPVRTKLLPPDVAAVASLVAFPGLRFDETDWIDVPGLVSCHSAAKEGERKQHG